jgi:hypothetical protein
MLGDLNAMTANSTATDISIPDLETLSSQVDQSNVVLSDLITSPNGLYGPIKNARMTFDSDMTKITGLLSRGGQALHYAIPFLGGSGQKTYFLAAENNAEMRDQGAVLSWALLQATNGSYSVDSAQPVSALYLRAPAPFTLPQGTQTVFGALNPTQLWQSTNPWADFTLSGADMSTMYTAATHGQHVDGVIALDVVTLQDILGLTGPVKVPDLPIPVNAGNVESLVLNRLYARYPPDAQQARRDELSAIAKAAVDALKKSKVDVAQLVKTFSKDVEGRHLILWDANATNERTVDSFGASGSVSSVDPTHTFHLAVESAVAAKLDYYIHTSIAYNVTLDKSGQALVQTRVTLENRAPRSGAPSYVLGPDNINSHRPGEYVSSIYLWSPAGSSTPGGISESGLVVTPTNTTVEAGSSASVSFQTVIPHAVVNGHLVLRFVPQSSMSPQTITLRVSGHDVAVQAPPQSSWLATSTKIISLPVG